MTPQQAIGQLRHLYGHMVNGRVTDCKEAATGLLGPAIEALEAHFTTTNTGFKLGTFNPDFYDPSAFGDCPCPTTN